MKERLKDILENAKTAGILIGSTLGPAAVIFAATIGGGLLLNRHLNNRQVDMPSYHLTSKAVGISGHTEYIRYNDGSQEIRKFPPLGIYLFGTELYQDVNGNGLTDRIRKDANSFKLNRLNNVLIRDFDYTTHQKEFDEADRELRDFSFYSR